MKYTPTQIRNKVLELVFNGVIAKLPNRVFGRARPAFLRAQGAAIGHDVRISRKVKVLGAKNLVIEDAVSIANSVIVDARGGLTIRQGALIGFESVLLTHTHAWPDPHQPVHHQGAVSRPIEIGQNSWLGARVIVLPGASIGQSVVVGANSVVTKQLESMTVAAGTPAKVVSARRDRTV